ncbi:hypothetical protein F5146DRAFT_611084 [Armillaria mellea]|nr:hypothetical protein F5146DRAFT_611084 [Armillaria mellea]
MSYAWSTCILVQYLPSTCQGLILREGCTGLYLSQPQQPIPRSKTQFGVLSRVRPIPNLSKTGNRLLGLCQWSDFSGRSPRIN